MVMTTTKTVEAKTKRQFPIIRSMRFTAEQWEFLEATEKITGCAIAEFVRRLIDAERNRKDGKK